MGLHCAKNFVTSNAVEAILSVPVNRRRPPIDYLKKEDFGRVPVRRTVPLAASYVEKCCRARFVKIEWRGKCCAPPLGSDPLPGRDICGVFWQ